MYTLTRQQREILEIAMASGGSITIQKAGATELNELGQTGYITIAPEGSFKITSAGTKAVDTPATDAA